MNDKKKMSVLLAVLSMIFGACAAPSRGSSARVSGGPRPDWIEGDSPEYPRERFITGVGNADDDATAADRARGEISRVFSADVAVDTSVDESESNSSGKGGTSHSFSQNVAESVRTASRKILEGADIVKRWKDPTGRYYALAVLPKAQALLAVTEKLHDLNEQSAAWKAKLDQAADRFGKAVAAAKLLTLAKARESLGSESRVLGGESGNSGLGALKAQATQALAALNVHVSAAGEGSDAIATGLVAGLNAAGLSATLTAAADGSSDISVSAASTVEPLPQNGDPRWQWSRASATIELRDARSGKTFSRFDLSDREASANASEARRRALAGLAKRSSDQVKSAVDEFFANQ